MKKRCLSLFMAAMLALQGVAPSMAATEYGTESTEEKGTSVKAVSGNSDLKTATPSDMVPEEEPDESFEIEIEEEEYDPSGDEAWESEVRILEETVVVDTAERTLSGEVIPEEERKRMEEEAKALYKATPSNLERPAVEFSGETEAFSVTVKAPRGAFPEGTEMSVSDMGREESLAAVSGVELENEDDYIRDVQAVDITFIYEKEVIEPKKEIAVSIVPKEVREELAEIVDRALIVHAPEGKDASVVEHELSEAEGGDGTETAAFSFSAKEFSPYAVCFVDTYTDGELSYSDDERSVRVVYGKDAKIPKDVTLNVTAFGDEEGEAYRLAAEAEVETASTIKVYDFSLAMETEEKVEPQADVTVSVGYEGIDTGVPHKVIHFTENGAVVIEPEVADENTLRFKTDGFSVYAIVEAPEVEVGNATDVSELDGSIFTMHVRRSGDKWFSDSVVNVNSGGSTKWIGFTTQAEAAVYHFELVEGTDDEFWIWTEDPGGNAHYLTMDNKDNLYFSDTKVTPFTASRVPNTTDCFYFTYDVAGVGTRYINQKVKGGNNNGFGGSYASDAGSYIVLRHEMEDDSYDLGGKTYGIVYNNEDISAAQLTATAGASGYLKAETLLVRPDVLTHDGVLLVSQEHEIAEWTFENDGENYYFLSTEVNGVTRYLTLTSSGVTLADEPDPVNSRIEVTAGSGANKGTYQFSIGSAFLQLKSVDDGFNTYNATSSRPAGATSRLKLVEKSELLTEDDFVQYSARKVSISDRASVPDGANVILYTRKWNENTLEYEYYAVDYDGSLVRCYESGDSIRWVGSRINTMLWDFTEYYYEGTNNPNYYYELQNAYSGKYIAPQLQTGEALADSKIGINMNGRRYGADYSKIVAWDDPHYTYTGIRMEDNHIVSCPVSQAEDFYFAIMDEPVDEEALTTITTIDNDDYGITMKMIDFNNAIVSDRDSKQRAYFGTVENAANLLQDHLEADGYPLSNPDATGVPAQSLSYLYNTTDGLSDVNHLFLESVHNESGYFEIDSTKNYAYLESNGDFTVYEQLGTISGSGASRNHGQFLPYNSLINPETGKPWPYSTEHFNVTDTTNKELPESDPRKGEKMHEIPRDSVDYFFGMEMEATFAQTVSGLDAWGNDIIFQFSGDDDMWLYIDGEMVLDLGGVHSAYTGSVNFRTGIVKSTRGNSTLYDIFRQHYISRNPSATAAEVNAYLDEIFEEKENGQYAFRNYTAHTMKMFYMERGAGSSNLKMKFNLTSVKPGEVRIGKTLSGTDKQDYASTQFAYQVWYDPGTGFELVDPTKCDVFYAETTEPVAYQREYHGYDHVFMLRPGEEMTVQLPDDEIEYYVTECYVQSNIYDEVTANGTVLTGVGNGHRDYTSSTAEAGKRKKLIYNNHVDENALRTLRITKRLYDFQGNRLDAGDDPTGFMFRLYLGDALDYYRFDTYYVLDPNGMYCRYDSATRKFVSLGVDDFNRLTDAQKEQAGFLTSMNGAVDKIPADYTVELRDLLVGTKFKVEERNADIPKGYRLRDPNGYTRVDGSYIIEEGDTENSGVIRDNANPHIEINNVRGWGVTATKIWSDDSFMDYHDDLYFGIYVNGTLVPDTLRELDASDGEKSLYWFFEDLLYSDDFDDYVVREVKVEDPVVDADGYVTSFTSAAPITGTFSHGGKQKDTAYRPDYRYEVTYRQGVPTGAAHHIREDEVENTREGLKLVKTDWDGNPISGGTFIFTDENGAFPGAESYTAGTDGLITIAYVPPGTYTLTETEAPFGYARLEESIEVTIASDGTVTAAASDPANVNVTQATASAMAKVELKNKEYEFKVKKIDGGTGDPIEGVHFAIFRDILGVKDYSPLAGYENLVTDEDGFLPETISELQGTFYLQELRPETGFLPLEGPIKFTVSKTGDVSIADTQYADWLTENSTGSKKCWLLTVPNHDSVDIAVEKKLTGNMARRGDTFPFAVSDVRLKNGTVLTGSFPYEIHRKTAEIEAGTAQISGGVTFVSASGSSSTVTLGQDDRLVLLGLPKDVSFKVAELAADGYRTSFTVSNIGNRIVYYDGTAVTPAGSTANVTTSVSGREAVINGTSTGLLVEVENRRHAPVPTGTQPLRLKLILLTLLSALSAFIALGAWKRRKK